MCDVTEEQVSHTKNFPEKGMASAKEHGGHRRQERSKEGRCGQGRQVLGTDFAELCKPRTGFHLEQAAGDISHALPTPASLLTLVRTLSLHS